MSAPFAYATPEIKSSILFASSLLTVSRLRRTVFPSFISPPIDLTSENRLVLQELSAKSWFAPFLPDVRY